MFDGTGNDFPGNALRPVGVGEERVNHIQIQTLAVGGDEEAATAVLKNCVEIGAVIG